MKKLQLKTIKLSEYQPHPENPNTHPETQLDHLGESLNQFGQFKNVVVWKHYLLAGHGMVEAAIKSGLTHLEAHDVSHLSNDQAKSLMVADNRTAELSIMDNTSLSDLLASMDTPLEIPGIDEEFLQSIGLELEPEPEDLGEPPEPETSKAEQLAQDYGVKEGQLWRLGNHLLICGDCTSQQVISKLMGSESASLLVADPPYGMGKEKDGVVNDNLYREKLDKFQMQWWQACRPFTVDNGSVYIWGNAEDLFRLWYMGGLKDSERLTFRNEIIWDKKNESGKYDGNGIGSGIHRLYASLSERCLFFMIGEQGFNENADNYWDGWEPIRKYLYDNRVAMGWDVPTMKRIVGHSDLSRDHWTSKSQWNFPTRDVYEKMQKEAKRQSNNDAFKKDYDELKKDYDELKKDYDELKKDFYSTRAYFDNTHENMTDVWNFPRVTGDERHEHATPKPVELMQRIIKSSSRDNEIVLSPFIGSGTDLITCEQLGRQCRGVEIAPEYVAVTLHRWETYTGKKAELINDG